MMNTEALLDIPKIRQDFPILQRSWENEKGEKVDLVYLDNAATTQKPLSVIQSLQDYYSCYNANIHRALHHLGEEATVAYEEARAKVAQFIGASKAREILFTRGTTESINLIAQSFGKAFLKEGDEILLTEMEHHSNLVPWHFLKEEKGVVLKFIPFQEDGSLEISDLDGLLTEKTKLVSMVHMSNVLGTINPVKEVIEKAHERGIPVLIDGAQSVPHMPINVKELDCDFLAFSAHKMCGPTGVGVLYGKEEWLEKLPPYQGGGEMILSVWLDRSTYNEIPHKFEAGTPPIAQAIGFGAALDYLQTLGMEKIFAYEKELAEYAFQALSEIKGIRFYGHAKPRGGLISFGLDKVHPHDISQFLDYHGIAIRAGHHCAQPIMRKFNIPATARASFYF
ncbi:MAG: cysteine desulfurase [Planctomycetota bacterium]|nr:MAG: cysteine desulfurase [Planctomycetota bacterium]